MAVVASKSQWLKARPQYANRSASDIDRLYGVYKQNMAKINGTSSRPATAASAISSSPKGRVARYDEWLGSAPGRNDQAGYQRYLRNMGVGQGSQPVVKQQQSTGDISGMIKHQNNNSVFGGHSINLRPGISADRVTVGGIDYVKHGRLDKGSEVWYNPKRGGAAGPIQITQRGQTAQQSTQTAQTRGLDAPPQGAIVIPGSRGRKDVLDAGNGTVTLQPGQEAYVRGTDGKYYRVQNDLQRQQVIGSYTLNGQTKVTDVDGRSYGLDTPKAAPAEAPAPAPSIAPPSFDFGGGGGGGSNLDDYATVMDYIDMINAAANSGPATETEESPESEELYGIENTVKADRTTRDEETGESIVEQQAGSTFLTMEGLGLSDTVREVVDPVTGAVYPNPNAARRAGVTNWVYRDEWDAKRAA